MLMHPRLLEIQLLEPGPEVLGGAIYHTGNQPWFKIQIICRGLDMLATQTHTGREWNFNFGAGSTEDDI